MSCESSVVDFRNIIKEFIAFRRWKDEVFFNDTSEKWYVNKVIVIGSFGGELIVEGRDSTGVVEIFFYYGTKCNIGKIDELVKLLNWVNHSSFWGNFECLPDGTIRWKLKFDTENAALTGFGLSQNVQHGWDVAGTYADAIMAVAFKKTSADQAIFDLNQSRAYN